MHSFTDNTGAAHVVNVTVAAIARARAVAGVDLYHLITITPDGTTDDKALQDFCSDPVKIAAVAYAVCRPAGLTLDEFCERLDAPALDAAGTAILADIVDFFPLAVRIPLRKILAVMPAVRAEAEQAVEAWTESAAFTATISPTPSNSSTNTPE